MSKATEDQLSSLHGAFAEFLKDQLVDLKAAEDSKGMAATLNVIRQFLKDNGIEAIPGKGGSEDAFGDLIRTATGGEDLPFSSDKLEKH